MLHLKYTSLYIFLHVRATPNSIISK